MTLAVVRDLREAGPAELAGFETDVLAGFVLARAAAGLSDGTISSDVMHLEQVRAWFGRPLWDMEPADADKRGGAGSNPAAPTKFVQLDGFIKTLIWDLVTTAGNHRCILPGMGKASQGRGSILCP